MNTISKDVLVKVPHGIHLRVASGIVQLLKKFKSKIYFTKGKQQARADSVLELVMLEATENSQIRITANGTDAQQAIAQVEEYFTDGGGI